MSVPREILDQLLSGYLDETLSGDERTQLERLLREDAAVAQELEDLQQIRSELKEIRRIDAGIQLDAGFSNRVIDAAIAQAHNEGLGEDHALVKLAEQPANVSPVGDSKTTPWLKVAGGLAALAASVAVAIVVMPPSNDEPITIAAIPESSNQQAPVDLPSVDISTDILDGHSPKVAQRETDASPGAPVLADNDADATPMVAAAVPKTSAPNGDSPNEAPVTDGPSPSALAEAMATVQGMHGNKVDEDALSKAMAGLDSLMVMRVTRTEAGRQARAVRTAMQASRIRPTEEKMLADDMVGALTEATKDDDTLDGPFQVLYLEVGANKFDYLGQSLVADTDGIEEVGFSMIATPLAKEFSKRLKKNLTPAEARQPKNWRLKGMGLNMLAGELARTEVKRVKLNGPPSEAPLEEDGPVQLSRILILVQ